MRWQRYCSRTAYRPPLPNGVPNVSRVVGYTASSPTVATILNDDGSGANNLPSGWTYTAASKLIRVNGNANNWDFRGLNARYAVQFPAALSQCEFDLSNYTVDNQPFITTSLNGAYYSIVNCTLSGLESTANLTACCSGVCTLNADNLVTRWPTDWCNPSPMTARPNSTVVGLGYGIAVASNIGLDFICTTAGTTAGSEPAGYASAINGGTVTDGTAVFTAQNTKHILKNNYVDIASSGPLHPDGMQIQGTSWDRGANLEVNNNIIDLSRPVSGGVTSRNINFAGDGSNIAVDMHVHDNILLNVAGIPVMSWDASGATITGSARYLDNYFKSNAQIFYAPGTAGHTVGANLTMSGCKNCDTGATLTFSVQISGTTITSGLSSYP